MSRTTKRGFWWNNGGTRWHKSGKEGATWRCIRITGLRGRSQKQKHRAYKRLETDGLLKVEHVIYYKDVGAVEIWFTTDKEIDDIHKLLKESAAKEERA